MGKKKSRSAVKSPKPRAMLFLYLSSGGEQKRHYYESIKKHLQHYGCSSLADFAYLAMTRQRLPNGYYREYREVNGKLSVYYGGITNGRVVSSYGHMVIALKQPKTGKSKVKIEIEYNRQPKLVWDENKKWTMGRREYNRLVAAHSLKLQPAWRRLFTWCTLKTSPKITLRRGCKLIKYYLCSSKAIASSMLSTIW